MQTNCQRELQADIARLGNCTPPGFYISLEIIKVSLGICEVWLVFYAAEAILFIFELCTALPKVCPRLNVADT